LLLPTSTPELVDGFEFDVTLHRGMNMDMLKLFWKFSSLVDDQDEPVPLRVRSCATGMWTVEVMFDRFGEMYLTSGWKRFCRMHQIEAGHFVVTKYDGDYTLTVSIFDETMCRRHYIAAAAANDSNSDDE
jgi:hypothetical protein